MANKRGVKLPAVGQIGVVVKDIDKTMEYYSTTFGIGPWRVMEVDNPGVLVRGKTCPFNAKVAFAQLGPVQLELIQVISGRPIHSEFLEAGREGLHHLGFFVDKEEKEQMITSLAEAGIGVVQGAETLVSGGSYAYLDTDEIGGVLFELLYLP